MAVPQTIAQSNNDIASVVATLASRQNGRAKSKPMTGPQRAAILMLALGEQYGGKVWALLDDDEVRELSVVMSSLGTVEADVVESGDTAESHGEVRDREVGGTHEVTALSALAANPSDASDPR